MRGKAPIFFASSVIDRITPAYAGKSYTLAPHSCRKRDHPRLCGEKKSRKRVLISAVGSPPPMRGKELFPVVSVRRLRITPAYAGKRFLLWSNSISR